MFTLRVPSTVIPRAVHCFRNYRINVRLFTSKVFECPPEIHYPNNNRKLANYLEYLSRTDESNGLCHKYAMRVSTLQQLLDLSNEMKDEQNAELIDLAQAERKDFIEQLNRIDEEIIDDLLDATSEETYDALVVEVKAGVGGKEASLFSDELYEMYVKYLAYKQFNFIELEKSAMEGGGLRYGSIMVRDKRAYSLLVHEAGVHRVQRVPKTEKRGRMQTSTAIMAAVPCPDDIQINLNPADLRIETKRASGPGGQNVNKSESAVRIVHIPTGMSVECQEGRTQHQNKETAMSKLYAKLYQIELRQQKSATEQMRLSQVGSGVGLRNEKLRTYNFQQNRVIDHRLSSGGTICCVVEEFMRDGEQLDDLINKVRSTNRKLRLEKIIENF